MAFKEEYTAKIKSNLKRRVDAITMIPDNVTDMFSVLADNIKATKPVQGVIEAAKKLGDGTLNFLKRQCEITREWK
jgi:hypothetical protein